MQKAMNAMLCKPGIVIPLETLCKVFSEVMSLLNKRPICPASDDLNDMELTVFGRDGYESTCLPYSNATNGY